MLVDPRYVYTAASFVVLGLLVYLVRGEMSRELKGLHGYVRLIYLVTSALLVVNVAYLAYLWGVLQVFVGSVAAAGALGFILLLMALPLMADMMYGVLIHLVRDINVGVDVEIDGMRGIIEEISLTRTRIVSDDGVIIFPNRRFRETAVIVRGGVPDGHR